MDKFMPRKLTICMNYGQIPWKKNLSRVTEDETEILNCFISNKEIECFLFVCFCYEFEPK